MTSRLFCCPLLQGHVDDQVRRQVFKLGRRNREASHCMCSFYLNRAEHTVLTPITHQTLDEARLDRMPGCKAGDESSMDDGGKMPGHSLPRKGRYVAQCTCWQLLSDGRPHIISTFSKASTRYFLCINLLFCVLSCHPTLPIVFSRYLYDRNFLIIWSYQGQAIAVACSST